jgi:putative heme transporter
MRPAVRWLLRVLVAAAALTVGIAIVGRRMPGVDEVAMALRSGDSRWLALAVVLEMASIAGFGAQERLLMRAMGVPMGMPRAFALAGAQAAIAMALPAGSAVATGFTLRQLRRAGGRSEVAVTTVLLSGVASTLGLLIPYLTTVTVSLSGRLNVSPVAAGVAAVLFACCVVVVTWQLPDVIGRRLDRRGPRPESTGRLARVRRLIRETFEAMRGIPSRTWYTAVAMGAVNWTADMLCLAALGAAFHVHVDAWALAVGYLGVQVGRFVSAGSGGVGVVEPALLAVLIASGVPAAPAAAVVVAYRLLSCWLVILAGLPIAAVLYQADRRSAALVSPATPGQPGEPAETEQARPA